MRGGGKGHTAGGTCGLVAVARKSHALPYQPRLVFLFLCQSQGSIPPKAFFHLANERSLSHLAARAAAARRRRHRRRLLLRVCDQEVKVARAVKDQLRLAGDGADHVDGLVQHEWRRWCW